MRQVGAGIAVLVVVIVGALAGAALLSPEPAPLRLGTNVWIGYEPLHVAAARGALTPGVDLVEYVSTTQVMSAFLNGELDAAAVTLDEALRLAATSTDVELVAVTDMSHGADAVVVAPERSGLKGARVGVERTALGAYLLMRALEHEGLREADVTIIPLTINEQAPAWDAGQVDALVTFEPVLTDVQHLGARALFTSRDIPGEVVDLLVLRRSAEAHTPGARRLLRQAWQEARDWAVSHPGEFARLASRRMRARPDDVQAQVSGVQFPTLEESDRLVSGGLKPTATRMAAVLTDAGISRVEAARVDGLFVGGAP